MPKRVNITLLALIMALGSLLPVMASCQNGEEETEKLGVVVTLLPQQELVEQVGGDKVKASVMVPPGASPHTYEPKPSQLVALEEAEIYFKVGSGIDFELVWMENLLDINPDMLLVDCSEGINLIDGSHEYRAIDPHIWMSPLNAVIMVGNICQGLIALDSQNKDYYETNRDSYIASLEELDSNIRQRLAEVENRTFMVYHSSFGYFAEEYGLLMLAIEDEGKEPTPEELQLLIEQAIEHDIHVVFTEPQFNPQSAEVIATEIGGTVVPIDPLAENYLENMMSLSEALISAME